MHEFFEIEIESLAKINFLTIVWSYPPSNYFILGSKNAKEFELLIPIRNYTLDQNNLIHSNSYFEEIELVYDPFIRFLRIIFLGTLFDFYGIITIKAFSYTLPFFIIAGEKLFEKELCLTFDEKNEILMKPCLDLFNLNDQSFLWTYEKDQTIRPYLNQTCCIQINFQQKKEGRSSLNLYLKSCADEIPALPQESLINNNLELKKIEDYIYFDKFNVKNSILQQLNKSDLSYLMYRSQFFTLDEKRRILLKNNEKMCFSTLKNLELINEINPIIINVNSTINLANYNIKNILDDKESFWASKPYSKMPIMIEVFFFQYL